jgi:hypothetical protein
MDLGYVNTLMIWEANIQTWCQSTPGPIPFRTLYLPQQVLIMLGVGGKSFFSHSGAWFWLYTDTSPGVDCLL